MLCSFHCRVLAHFLVKFIPKCFMVFDGIVNAFTYFIFHLFAASKRNQLSLYIYLLSCHLINLLVSIFFIGSVGFPLLYFCCLWIETVLHLLSRALCFFFPCFVVLTSAMMNRSGESWLSFFVSNLSGKYSMFHH